MRSSRASHCSSNQEGLSAPGGLNFMLNCFSVCSSCCWLPAKYAEMALWKRRSCLCITFTWELETCEITQGNKSRCFHFESWWWWSWTLTLFSSRKFSLIVTSERRRSYLSFCTWYCCWAASMRAMVTASLGPILSSSKSDRYASNSSLETKRQTSRIKILYSVMLKKMWNHIFVEKKESILKFKTDWWSQ